MKIMCRIFGHRFLYNYSSLPTRCICSRCRRKWRFDYGSSDLIINGPVVVEVVEFEMVNRRSDEDLIKSWVE